MPSNRDLYISTREFLEELDKQYGLPYLTDNRQEFADQFNITKRDLVDRFREAYWLRGTPFLLFCSKYNVVIGAVTEQFIVDAQTKVPLSRGWAHSFFTIGTLRERIATAYEFYCNGFIELNGTTPIIATRAFNIAVPNNPLPPMP